MIITRISIFSYFLEIIIKNVVAGIKEAITLIESMFCNMMSNSKNGIRYKEDKPISNAGIDKVVTNILYDVLFSPSAFRCK